MKTFTEMPLKIQTKCKSHLLTKNNCSGVFDKTTFSFKRDFSKSAPPISVKYVD